VAEDVNHGDIGSYNSRVDVRNSNSVGSVADVIRFVPV